MPTETDWLSDILDAKPVEGTSSNRSIDRDSEVCTTDNFREPGYEGAVDYRIRQLSYSSLLTLHTCPRKFQLYKLRSSYRTAESEKSNITFAFGHIIGEAIQLTLEGKSREAVIFQMFLSWHADLFASDDKAKKSFWLAIEALDVFISIKQQGFLKDYDLVYIEDIPACELSFAINLPDGFRLRGFIDAVLKNRVTSEVIVLEVKTTGSAQLNPATYKNSAQAIGYSIAIDQIFPKISSYKVLYLVYQTRTKEYTIIPFTKTYLQRALWIRELLLDIELIKMYELEGVYPMHGESCYSFFRECEYLNTCTLSTAALTLPCTPEEEDRTDYQFNISLFDLLNTQLEKLAR